MSHWPSPSACVSPYRAWQTSSRGEARLDSLAASAIRRLFFRTSEIEAWTCHGTGVEHGQKLLQVQAMSVGKMKRLCEAGDHGDQEQVDRELHEQPARDRSAYDRLAAHRFEQRANLLHGGALDGQHRHELPGLGGLPRAGDGSFDIAAAGGANVGVEPARVAGRGRPHVDDRVLRDVRAEFRRAPAQDGVHRGAVGQHEDDDARRSRTGQIERHGLPHDTETDETYVHRGTFTSRPGIPIIIRRRSCTVAVQG